MAEPDVAYPDAVLTLMPLTLLTAHFVGVTFEAYTVAISTALVVCCLLMLDSLFWHTPVG
ncbi:hypothetical protein [Halorubrum coriense]|uniref:hypothetical protein n=1 Tax=Halorubrum coriense TaxID=64713 RepID=UPI001268E1D6|nr:hypothetical protein [Halorubrum coriense]